MKKNKNGDFSFNLNYQKKWIKMIIKFIKYKQIEMNNNNNN